MKYCPLCHKKNKEDYCDFCEDCYNSDNFKENLIREFFKLRKELMNVVNNHCNDDRIHSNIEWQRNFAEKVLYDLGMHIPHPEYFEDETCFKNVEKRMSELTGKDWKYKP
jgi:phage regulator Rha-like protein